MIRLWHQLLQPEALVELVAFLGCLALAWLLVRLWRGQQSHPRSIWFGHHIVDGVLFPVLALGLALIARRVMLEWMPVTLFKLVIPILVSLAVIRLTVKVLRVFFPASTTVVAVERTVSWLAWIGTILWVTGILPLVLDELQGITLKIGATTVSLRDLIEGALSSVLVLILALSVSSAIEARLLRGATTNLSTRKIAANVTRSALLVLGLMLALSTAGVDLTALSVLGAPLVWAWVLACKSWRPITSAVSSSWPSAACASEIWSRSTTSKAASPTSTPATRCSRRPTGAKPSSPTKC